MIDSGLQQTTSLLLHAMTYLMVKHTVVDFFLQSDAQRLGKGVYGSPAGLLHSAVHILLTVPVWLILPHITWQTMAVILVAEFVIHYHVDWLKDQMVRSLAVSPSDRLFWWLLGLDQLIHGLTYVGILWVGFVLT